MSIVGELLRERERESSKNIVTAKSLRRFLRHINIVYMLAEASHWWGVFVLFIIFNRYECKGNYFISENETFSRKSTICRLFCLISCTKRAGAKKLPHFRNRITEVR